MTLTLIFSINCDGFLPLAQPLHVYLVSECDILVPVCETQASEYDAWVLLYLDLCV